MNPMREAYNVELENLATKLADMSVQVADAMERATKAMLESDLELAEQVISDDALVDDARADCEEQAYALLALQAPVATDLRIVLAAIHAAESLERMGDLALHVAKAARRRHPEPVPRGRPAVFRRHGQDRGEAGPPGRTDHQDRDIEAARRLETEDQVDDIHGTVQSSWPRTGNTVWPLLRTSRCSAVYERYADHAVSVARRMVFVVTGRMPGH